MIFGLLLSRPVFLLSTILFTSAAVSCSNVYFSIPSLGVTCSYVLPLLRLLVNASTLGNLADVHMPSMAPKRFHLSIHPSIHPSKYCSHCDSLEVADQRHHMAATCTAISAKSVNRQHRPLQPLLVLLSSHHALFHHHLLPCIYFYSLTTTAPHRTRLMRTSDRVASPEPRP